MDCFQSRDSGGCDGLKFIAPPPCQETGGGAKGATFAGGADLVRWPWLVRPVKRNDGSTGNPFIEVAGLVLDKENQILTSHGHGHGRGRGGPNRSLEPVAGIVLALQLL